ncbi:MAG: hypothetical protein NZM31_12275 [Gemmatales bacterium]|nr:hypothetical protein [Gemmatales bacterium]MDW8387771.1 hypothetical protein [Gemmatales bacterium]
MRLALDALAASISPEAVAASAAKALAATKDVRLTLVGDPHSLNGALSGVEGRTRERISVYPASQGIHEGEDPETALRFRPDTSIGRCWQLLIERKVDGLISLGPLNAVVAAGMRLRRLVPQVRRPGLAGLIQTTRSRWLVVDAGAFAEATPPHLYQYGVMGLMLHRVLSESDKGRCVLLRGANAENQREADRLLEAGLSPHQYAGIVEPAGAFRSDAEVLVCSGSLGAVLMRTGNSVADLLREAELPGPRVSAVRPLLGFIGYPIHLTDLGALPEAVSLAQRLESARLNDGIAEHLQFGPLVGAVGEDG